MSIYFVRSNEFVKIGYSAKPMSRIAALQTANPSMLELLVIMPGTAVTEKELHSVFSEYHHLNEWYRCEGDLELYIEATIPIFANYTSQFEQDGSYQDERDWEYWKERALSAEEKTRQNINRRNDVKSTEEISTDWRRLTDRQRYDLAHATREERAEIMPELADRTRRLWHERLDEIAAQNGSYVESK